MPRVLVEVKRNNSRAMPSLQKKVTKFLYTEEVRFSTMVSIKVESAPLQNFNSADLNRHGDGVSTPAVHFL